MLRKYGSEPFSSQKRSEDLSHRSDPPADEDLRNCTVLFRVQSRFHLHGFDGQQHVAGLDQLACRDGDSGDDTRHCGTEMSSVAAFDLAADSASRIAIAVGNSDRARLAVDSKKTLTMPYSSTSDWAWLRTISVLPFSI